MSSSPTNSTSPPPPPPPPTASSTGSNSTTSPPPPPPTTATNTSAPLPGPPKDSMPPGVLAVLIVGVVLGAMLVLVGVGVFVIFYMRKKKRKLPELYNDDVLPLHRRNQIPPPLKPSPSSTSGGTSSDADKPLRSPGFPHSTFSYEELAAATDDFSPGNLLGQGGFGYVHKGVLAEGKVVAIKQLKAGSLQGEREFSAEVEIISRVHHRHLVSLVGYCIAGAKRLLVYEFVPNNTLQFHLHGKGRPCMEWSTRMRIALGAAKGLAYLHEDCNPKIIHRDIKAANILLDYKFEAKVADFGLARCFEDTETHVSTRVVGTFGYLAPEYACTGNLTEKSDVFSFGVVLLELITGRRPVDRTKSCLDESIVDWARPLLKQCLEDGNYDPLIDPRLQNVFDSSEMTRMIYCAAACVRHLARIRPKMSQIVRALEGNLSLDELSEGISPGFSMVYTSSGSPDHNSGQYEEDLKNLRKTSLERQEHGKREQSGRRDSKNDEHHSGSGAEYQAAPKEVDLQGKETKTEDSHQTL